MHIRGGQSIVTRDNCDHGKSDIFCLEYCQKRYFLFPNETEIDNCAKEGGEEFFTEMHCVP